MPWPKVRITVLKRAVFEDICREYGEKEFLERGGCSPCGRFQDGQEFILDHGLDKPDNFCTYAFADIRHELMVVLNGGSRPYVRAEGTAIVCCTDAMKPVLFKIERIESE
jgi:uncharacterized repeat protein (TIGR04076 family)